MAITTSSSIKLNASRRPSRREEIAIAFVFMMHSGEEDPDSSRWVQDTRRYRDLPQKNVKADGDIDEKAA
jgi:hypothetical protein